MNLCFFGIENVLSKCIKTKRFLYFFFPSRNWSKIIDVSGINFAKAEIFRMKIFGD